MGHIASPMLVAALLLADPEGGQTRYWPIYFQVMAWSVRSGELKVWGPFCMN